MLPGFNRIVYKEKLDKLGLFALQHWRFRVVNRSVQNYEAWVFPQMSNTRKHRFMVRGEKFDRG